MSLCDCGKISFGFSFFFRRGRKWRLGRKFHWKVTNARKIEACSMCYACVYIAVRRLRGCRSTALKLEEKQDDFLLLLNLISTSRDKSRVFFAHCYFTFLSVLLLLPLSSPFPTYRYCTAKSFFTRKVLLSVHTTFCMYNICACTS